MSDPTRTQHPVATGSDAESRAPDATLPRAPGTGAPGAPVPEFGPPAHAGELGTLGRYRVLEQLGAGGMGAVYLGYHTGLQCKLALKVMLADAAADSAARERFLREARTAAQVKSDHVVTIHDVDEAGGVPFIAMEYLLGAPLDAYLKKKGELPLGQAVRIVRECALGLAAVHAQGLIHRDIKPGNIWLEAPHGRAKLLDFGLARAESDAGDITATGGVVGTLKYMSPQQGRGEKVDARTDLWSLGVVLYRLCTGRMPFEGESQMAVLTSIAIDAPLAPRAVNPQMPPALDALILKLLAKDPAARFQTAQEVADALAAVERGDVPAVVAVPLPQSLAVSAQTQNVWESIADDSHSVAVPLAEPGEATGATRAVLVRRASKGPLLLGAAVLLAALAGLVVAVVRELKEPTDRGTPPDQPAVVSEPKGRVTITGAPPEVEFAIKRDGGVVQQTRSRSIQLPPGRYTIEFASTVAPGLKIVPDTVDVTIGGTHRVNVTEEKQPGVAPPPPDAKVYPLPPDLIGSMTPVKPKEVFTLDHLDRAKHVPAVEQEKWHPDELVAVLGSHRQRVPSTLKWVRTSPDGAFALAGNGYANSWRVDLKTGRVTDGPPVNVVSADFRRGAAGNKVFDLIDSKAVPVVYPSLGEVRAFLSDDTVLALKDDTYAIRKLDGKGDADVLNSFTKPEVVQFAVSPDAKYLALVFKDETCRVYDLAAGFNKDKFIVLPGTEGRTLAYAPTFSYTGRMSTTGRDGERSIGRVWDLSEMGATLVPSGGGGILTGDGKYQFGGGNEGYEVFRVGSDAKPLTTGYLHRVGGVFSGGLSSSRDGATVVTAQGGGVLRVWELKQGVLNERNPVRPQTLISANSAVSPDGRFAVVTKEGADAVLLNLADLTERELPAVGDFARFGPDGSSLATSGSGLRVRRAPDFAAAEKFVDGFVPHVFSPDGKWLACTSETELGIWDSSATPPRALWKVPGIGAQRADFTPDGRYLIARFCHPPHGMKVRAWAMGTSGPKLRYETDSFAPSYWESISPDGRTLAVCEHFDGLCLYDLDQGVPKAKRKFVAGLFHSCHYSPDGRLLLVWDGTVVKVLDATTGERLYPPERSGAERGAALGALWHPDGKHIFVTNADRTTYILRLPKDALAALDDPDRKAIEYVFSVGGAVSTNVGGEERTAKRFAELPAGAPPYRVSLEYQKNVSPEALAIFRDCRRLVGFNAHSTDITDAALAHVAVRVGLKHLDLHVCPNVTDAGLAQFKNCKHLEHLNLAKAQQITDAGLAHFAGCANLTFLDVRETRVTPAKVQEFAKALPNCKIVHNGGTIEPEPAAKGAADDREVAKYVLQAGGRVRARTGTGTVPVFKLDELPAGPLAVTYLELTNPDLSDDGWAKLAGLRALTQLNVTGAGFTDAVAARFDCPELEELRVYGTKVGDRGLAALAAGKKLRRADLAETALTGDGLKALAASPGLTDLTLTKTAVADAGLAHLAGAKALVWLHLSGTAVTDAGLKHLEGLQALRQLTLRDTKVTEPTLKALKLKLHPACQVEWDAGIVKP